VIKFGTGHLAALVPQLKKPLFFMGIMRNGLIVIVGTLLSFILNIGKESSPFKIIKDVPAGFDAMGIPLVRLDIIKESMGVLPSIILILVLEHVSGVGVDDLYRRKLTIEELLYVMYRSLLQSRLAA
jgi:sodium-independent sulfate anion transporter 11